MPDGASHRTNQAREWNRPDNRRRQSSSGAPTSGRPPGFYPPAPTNTPGYFAQPSLATHTDGILTPAGPSFQGPNILYTPPAYPQSAGFYGQYTVPAQPPLSIAHSTPYSYPHVYHPAPLPESSIGRPVPHSTYPHPPNQEEAGSSSTIASGPRSHPSSPAGNLSPTYMGSGQFPGMTYPSTIGTQQFAYAQNYTATTPPMYRPYGSVAYPHHPAPVPEDHQGTWYFLSHGTAPQAPQYRYEGPHYQHPYPAHYAQSLAANRGPYAPQQSTSRSLSAPLPCAPAGSHSAPPVGPPTPAGDNCSRYSSSRPPSAPSDSKPVTRREWHPRPPPHRSPWVMWVGNVPSDATREELARFFSGLPEDDSGSLDPGGAVVSIFLIARSNCAFINYADEISLLAAIQSFNGQRLRPNDPQCPMLVCKVRRSADDLKSGVGGQRGTGLHTQWVKEQQKLQSQAATSRSALDSSNASTVSRSSTDGLVDGMGSVAVSDPPNSRTGGTNQSSSSDSYASTSSSFLSEHFPNRYFILKSLSERDLELSVDSGLWATQKHNELVLDRAYRTSGNVYLIFSVNKSGEFYGFARMAGPIRQGEGSVSWSSRSHPSPPSLSSPTSTSFLPQDFEVFGEGPVFASPEDILHRSRNKAIGVSSTVLQAQPAELDKGRKTFDHYASAPAKLGGLDDSDVRHSPNLKLSLDQHQRRLTQGPKEAIHLDPLAPFKAMRANQPDRSDPDPGPIPSEDVHEPPEKEPSAAINEPIPRSPPKPSPTWGDCFKVEWRELRKVPFHRTRHLRNAWNKGREIKVSRDGTELESGVGRRLLEEWGQLIE